MRVSLRVCEMGIDSDCEEDDTILKFGPSDGTEFGPRVIFGHGVGGLDKYANTFIADMRRRGAGGRGGRGLHQVDGAVRSLGCWWIELE